MGSSTTAVVLDDPSVSEPKGDRAKEQKAQSIHGKVSVPTNKIIFPAGSALLNELDND